MHLPKKVKNYRELDGSRFCVKKTEKEPLYQASLDIQN